MALSTKQNRKVSTRQNNMIIQGTNTGGSYGSVVESKNVKATNLIPIKKVVKS